MTMEIFADSGRYEGFRSRNAVWRAAEDLKPGTPVVMTGTTHEGKYWQATFIFARFEGNGDGTASMYATTGQHLGMWERHELVAVSTTYNR